VEEVFTRFARLNSALMSRTTAVIALGEAAASTDPDLAEPMPSPGPTSGPSQRSFSAGVRYAAVSATSTQPT
jgi:hypothetical protein